jgi:hypothetical protein
LNTPESSPKAQEPKYWNKEGNKKSIIAEEEVLG